MYATLDLFETNLKDVDGNAPKHIQLSKYITNKKEDVSIIIGRGSPAFPSDIVVNARKDGREIISRNHAKLTYSIDGDWVIDDLGAINGIFVNHERIDSAILKHGDVLQLGGVANIPIGEVMEDSDLCIKYRFSALKENNERINESARNISNKRKKSSNNENGEFSKSKRKLNELEQKRKGLDDAHAALTTVLSSKDLLIGELQKSLEEVTSQLETSRSHVQKLESLVEARNANIKCLVDSVQCLKAENLDYSTRYTEIKKNLESVPEKLPQGQESPSSLSSSKCMISTSALEVLLECSLCNGTLVNPVIMSCSHSFCQSCIIRDHPKRCPVCEKSFSIDEGNVQTSSASLNSVLALLENFNSI